MKQLLSIYLLVCVMCLSGFSQSVQWRNLNTLQFSSNNFIVGIKGSGLTNLNASNLTSGTVSDARISSNVPLKDAANIFTQSNTFPNVGVTGTLGANTSTTVTLDVSGAMTTRFTNQFVWADGNGVLRGTNNGGGLTNISYASLPPIGQLTLSLSSTNCALDLSLVNSFTNTGYLLATTNVFFTMPVNLVSGKEFSVWIIQDATGNRTVNFTNSYFKTPGGVAQAATTNAGAIDLYTFKVGAFATNLHWSITPNFQ